MASKGKVSHSKHYDSSPGGRAIPPSLAERPRQLSSIPRFRRFRGNLIVNTDTGEVFGLPGRFQMEPDGGLQEGTFPGLGRVPRSRTFPPPHPRPRNVPKRVKAWESRSFDPGVCLGRYVRRRVLFALGLHGRHGAGGTYRRNAWSSFGC